MKVVGLGSAGCNIADCFAEYSQYQIYKIDNDLPKQKGNFPVARHASVEDYEENCPSFKNFFRGIRSGDDVLLVVSGGSMISSICLRVLEPIQRAKVSILYIAPDTSLLANKAQMHERVVFHVLQEYVRSGVFEKMYIAKNDINIANMI